MIDELIWCTVMWGDITSLANYYKAHLDETALLYKAMTTQIVINYALSILNAFPTSSLIAIALEQSPLHGHDFIC